MNTGDAVCVNCKDDCPDPTWRQHFMDEANLCLACGCDDFETENPE